MPITSCDEFNCLHYKAKFTLLAWHTKDPLTDDFRKQVMGYSRIRRRLSDRLRTRCSVNIANLRFETVRHLPETKRRAYLAKLLQGSIGTFLEFALLDRHRYPSPKAGKRTNTCPTSPESKTQILLGRDLRGKTGRIHVLKGGGREQRNYPRISPFPNDSHLSIPRPCANHTGDLLVQVGLWTSRLSTTTAEEFLPVKHISCFPIDSPAGVEFTNVGPVLEIYIVSIKVKAPSKNVNVLSSCESL